MRSNTPPKEVKTESEQLSKRQSDIKHYFLNRYIKFDKKTAILNKGPNFLTMTDAGACKFLNNSCNTIIDFGSGCGVETLPFKRKGWNIIAYDFSAEATQFLSSRGVAVRTMDLNQFDPKQITADLAQTANILSVDLLNYLAPKPLYNFLFHLLDNAHSESVFLFKFQAYRFADNIKIHAGLTQKEILETRKKQAEAQRTMQAGGFFTENFIASFFAPRTNIEIESHLAVQEERHKVDTAPGLENKDTVLFSEILIMRKR